MSELDRLKARIAELEALTGVLPGWALEEPIWARYPYFVKQLSEGPKKWMVFWRTKGSHLSPGHMKFNTLEEAIKAADAHGTKYGWRLCRGVEDYHSI